MKPWNIVLLMGLAAMATGCGYSKSYQQPTAGSTPAITQLAPDSATSGSAAFVLTVNGSSFNTNAVVNWNSAPLTTTYVTASQLMATVPASALTAPATAQVTVTNPGQAGGRYGGGTLPETSPAVAFTIN